MWINFVHNKTSPALICGGFFHMVKNNTFILYYSERPNGFIWACDATTAWISYCRGSQYQCSHQAHVHTNLFPQYIPPENYEAAATQLSSGSKQKMMWQPPDKIIFFSPGTNGLPYITFWNISYLRGRHPLLIFSMNLFLLIWFFFKFFFPEELEKTFWKQHCLCLKGSLYKL